MRRRMLADPPGRITPEVVFLVLGVALVAWYVAFTETSPTALGTPVADGADTAFRFSENLFKGAKPARPRRIIDVPAADRLLIAGLGEARLLGITVPDEQVAAALAYLRETVAGKRLAVTVATVHDPEKRPLVIVALEDGTLVNARLIQQGLADPWQIPGPWDEWTTAPS